MPLDLVELGALGFFKHVRAADRAGVFAWAEAHGTPFARETRRVFHADAECLAEEGFLGVLGFAAPFLAKEGVPLEVTYRSAWLAAADAPAYAAPAEPDSDGWLPFDPYVKPWGHTPVARLALRPRPGAPLEEVTESYDAEDRYVFTVGESTVAVLDAIKDGDHWVSATRALLGVLNGVLAAHGSSERAFGLYGGHDLAVAFATPSMASLINGASAPGDRLHDGAPYARARSRF